MGVRYSMGIAVTAAMACEVSVWRGGRGRVSGHRPATAGRRAQGPAWPHLRCYLIAAPEVERFDASGCVFRDATNRFAISYGIGDVAACAHVVRPDGYLAF